MSGLGWFVLVAVAVAAAILFGHRATKKEVTPTPGPLPVDNPPVIFEPFVTGIDSEAVYIQDGVKIDMRHRIHGCDTNGTPVEETGAYDPDGDLLEYKVECVGPNGDGTAQIHYTLWTESGTALTDGWIPNGSAQGFAIAPAGPGKPDEVQAICRFIAGWNKTETPYPFAPKCCPPAPTPQPVIDKTKLGEVRFTYSVRDTKLNVVSKSIVWPCYKNCKA